MTRGKRIALRRRHKSYTNKARVGKSSSLVSLKKSSSKDAKICIKKNTMRNISNYIDKKLRGSNKDNFISLNLRKIPHAQKKQHHEEVKDESNSEKSKITKEKIVPNKVQDEKLLVSPIVLLEILSMDRIKKTSIIEKIKVSSVAKSPNECIDSTKKSSHRNLRKYAYNKTEIQNIFDKQTCISRLQSNVNANQKLTNKSNDNPSTRSKIKLSNNSVLDEQINDKDTDDQKVESTNKEIFIEKETCPVNKNVKCASKKERHSKPQIEAKQKYFNQSTNFQEKSTHSKNTKTSINCEERKNCKDKHISIVKEIVKDFTEDKQLINLTLNEKIQNLNECLTENELCIDTLDKQKCNSITENNKEQLLGSKVIDEMTSIIEDESMESCESEQIEEVTPYNVENDACDDDEDDEEIIFYYINSANEVVKKVDVKRRSSSKIEKMKDDKAICTTPPVVNKENISASQPAINDSEVIINVKNQNYNNGSKKTVNADKTVLTAEEKTVDVAQPEISVKDKTLDNMEGDLFVTVANDDSTDIIEPISADNIEIITNNQTINTAKDKTIVNETLARDKEKTLNISQSAIMEKSDPVNINQPIVTDNDEDMEVDQFVVIEKDQNIKVYQSEVVDKTDTINNDKSTFNKKDEMVNINQSVNTTKNIKIISINETIVSEEGEIYYINSRATIGKANTVNLNKPAISNEDIDVNEYVHTEKDQTLNINQTTATEKNVVKDKYQLVIIEKDKNISIKQSAVVDKAETVKTNHVAITEKNKTNTVSQLINTEKDNTINESVTTENDEISMIGQHVTSEKDRKMKDNDPLITENAKNTNTNQSLITKNKKTTSLQNVKISNVNRSSNAKTTEVVNINQLVSSENNTEQDKIINSNQTVITKKRTVETNHPTTNETALVNAIKVEEVGEADVTDRIVDEVNLDANPSDKNKTNVSDVHIINTSDSIMSENIKVEVVDIPEDNIVTENNSYDAIISNQDISINAVSTQDIRESDTLTIITASEDERNDASIRAYDNDKNNDEQQEASAPESDSTSNESMDRSKAMFISFMEAYQRMKRDIAVNSLLSLNGAFNDVNHTDIGPEILHISDDSGNEVRVVEKKKEDLLAIQKPSIITAVTPVLPVNSVNLVNTVNPIRRKILLPNGGAVISASKLYGCGDGISVKERKEPSFTCPKCARVYKGEVNYKKHTKRCAEEVPLPCILCSTKIKHKRSLAEHLRRIHKHEVMEHEIKGIVNDIVKEANFRKNANTPMTSSMIRLPEFVKLFCNKCGKIYDRIHSDYYRECGTCRVSLLIFCQRCNTRCVVSPRISSHLNGDCEVGEPIKCPHCNYVSSQRHHIYQHIEDAHRTAPSTNLTLACSKGCARKFDRVLSLRRHEKYCGTKPNLRCKFCKYKTRHRSAIKMHMQQHVLRNDTKLSQQNFSDNSDTSDSNRTPASNIDEIHVRNLMEAYCSKCKVVVPMPPRYVHDCGMCNTRLTYNCNKCYLVPSRSHDYRHVRVHVIRCHTEKVYKCSSCDRRFAYYYDYTYHKSNCDKNMSFRCSICPYKSNLLKGLQGHMRRIHPNGLLESHNCTQCSKRFSSKETLQKHLRLYCGVDPSFSCAHCDFRTRTKFSLIRHIQNMHSEIFEHCRFQCVYCQKVYNNLYAHDTHVIICPKKPEQTLMF